MTQKLGPWFVRYCDDEVFRCMTVISSTDHGPSNTGQFADEADTIAIVFHQGAPGVSNDLDDCGEAHARLIAAAPELLEVLKDAYAFVHNDHTRARIGAVIAKAAGVAS